MEFRTPIHITPSPFKIDHSSKILTLGSCFANVMGEKLQDFKFQVRTNPFGVIFNPLSIFKVLEASAKEEDLFNDSYIQNNGIWYNYHLHSDMSAGNKEVLQQNISNVLSSVHTYIQTANVVTITFGTAFVYRLIKTNEAVANCHKIPAVHFKKELLSVLEIRDEFERLYSTIKKINPGIRFILTVSPVRHIKDGLEQNSVSKAILRLACQLIREKLQEVEYFPAFEIMMDDLRDYRFYKEDMIHPSAVAENYIWDRFLEKHIEKNSMALIKEWGSIKRALEHRPFHPETESYKVFLNETIAKLTRLRTEINVEEEIISLQNKLKG